MHQWQFGDVLKTEYIRIGKCCFIRRLIMDIDANTMQLMPRFWYQWIDEYEYNHQTPDNHYQPKKDGKEFMTSEPTSGMLEG